MAKEILPWPIVLLFFVFPLVLSVREMLMERIQWTCLRTVVLIPIACNKMQISSALSD